MQVQRTNKWGDEKVKYSVRHYAHQECFLIKKGEAGLRSLPSWKVGQFPYKMLQHYGLEHVAKELCAGL